MGMGTSPPPPMRMRGLPSPRGTGLSGLPPCDRDRSGRAVGEQTLTETWFHQGNDTTVDVNDPNVPDGYLKGAPYRTKVTDAQGNLYTQTTTTYTPDDDGVTPFFSPPASVVTDICDGMPVPVKRAWTTPTMPMGM